MAGTYADMMKHRDFGGDKVCITRMLGDVPGGVTLDLTGYAGKELKEGQVVVYNVSTGVYKPLAVSGTAYGALESGFSYEGVLISAPSVEFPLAGVMTIGQVVKARSPYVISEEIEKGLPRIQFI